MNADHLAAHLRTLTSASPPTREEDDAGLPQSRDNEYQAFPRPANKPLFALHFVSPSGDIRSFQYVHLDSGSELSAEFIVLRFIGLTPSIVRIVGRNLRKLYDYVHQHRIAWIMTTPRDFAPDNETIVTRVDFLKIDESE